MTEGLKTPQHSVALLCRLLLGITADSSPSTHSNMMFGTTLESCRHLLETAKEQAVEVVGIRYSTWSFFHRGAQPMLEGTVGSSALPEQHGGPQSRWLLWLGVRWRLDLGRLTLVGTNLGQIWTLERIWGPLRDWPGSLAWDGVWETQSCPQ